MKLTSWRQLIGFCCILDASCGKPTPPRGGGGPPTGALAALQTQTSSARAQEVDFIIHHNSGGFGGFSHFPAV